MMYTSWRGGTRPVQKLRRGDFSVSTLLENVRTGIEVQIWIEVRLGNSTDGGVEGTLLVVGYQ